MTFNPDDPKWTAYILGELDAAERTAMEALLESSEEARAYMEELRTAAGALEQELKDLKVELKVRFPPEINAAAAASLTEAQRKAIQAAAGARQPANRRWFKQPQSWGAGLAVAAAILIAAAIPVLLWHGSRATGADAKPTLSAAKTETAEKTDEKIPPSPAVPVETESKAPGSTEKANAMNPEALAHSDVEKETASAPVPPVPSIQPALTPGQVRNLLLPNNDAADTVRGGAPTGQAAIPAQPPISGDSLVDLPDNKDDLLTYLAQLAKAREAGGGPPIPVDGFSASNAGVGQGQGQVQPAPSAPQAQQSRGAAAAGNRGGGGGRGGGRGGAAPITVDGFSAATLPPLAAVRELPDNPTVLNGYNAYDRAAAGTASYAAVADNPFIRVGQNPLSTFSSDVDTASYSNIRRFLNQNQLPPRDAVRIEEMLNYFSYDYAQPSGRDPIGAQMEVASAPWDPSHRLVRIGIKARDIEARRRPASNLVFLIDVSGSMQPQERLPLIKSGLKMLADNLTENDHVSIVVYAGASGVVLPSTSGNRKDIITAALDRLEAGGSTNGATGIQLAYQIAASNFIPGGVNRVILATDGDFNVGITNQSDLTRLIQDRAKSGVFLSVLGVGTDNLKDSTMEKLADTGNGNYAYLDSLNEAYKVLVQQMGATLVTVAKDVKLQVEFNPAFVEAYRLIGYENRVLANSDFNNDRKDAGDMGAGHTVTALYEIVPRGGSIPGPGIDPLKYQTPAQAPVPQARTGSNETLTLKIRYKDPDGTESKLLSLPLVDREAAFSKASVDFRFAASVAEFGMILRDSPYRGNASIADVLDNAQSGKGSDRSGYRQEFIGLVQRARSIHQ